MDSTREKSKPCLRCGSELSRFERWVDTDAGIVRYRVLCGACRYAPDNWEEAPETAVEYWNTRPEEDRLRAELEQAREDAARLASAMVKLLRISHMADWAKDDNQREVDITEEQALTSLAAHDALTLPKRDELIEKGGEE